MKSNKTTLIIVGIVLALLVLVCGYFLYGMFAIADLPCAMSEADTRITDAYMSYDSDGKQPTNVFTPEAQNVYANLQLRCPFADTKVRAVLIAVDIEGTNPNTAVLEASYVISKSEITGRNLHLWFRFEHNLWPGGQYRVEIYFNDTLKTSIDFQVQ